jgi:hypothetical protein
LLLLFFGENSTKSMHANARKVCILKVGEEGWVLRSAWIMIIRLKMQEIFPFVLQTFLRQSTVLEFKNDLWGLGPSTNRVVVPPSSQCSLDLRYDKSDLHWQKNSTFSCSMRRVSYGFRESMLRRCVWFWSCFDKKTTQYPADFLLVYTRFTRGSEFC